MAERIFRAASEASASAASVVEDRPFGAVEHFGIAHALHIRACCRIERRQSSSGPDFMAWLLALPVLHLTTVGLLPLLHAGSKLGKHLFAIFGPAVAVPPIEHGFGR